MIFPPPYDGCSSRRATPSLRSSHHTATRSVPTRQNATYLSRETVQTTGASALLWISTKGDRQFVCSELLHMTESGVRRDKAAFSNQ